MSKVHSTTTKVERPLRQTLLTAMTSATTSKIRSRRDQRELLAMVLESRAALRVRALGCCVRWLTVEYLCSCCLGFVLCCARLKCYACAVLRVWTLGLLLCALARVPVAHERKRHGQARCARGGRLEGKLRASQHKASSARRAARHIKAWQRAAVSEDKFCWSMRPPYKEESHVLLLSNTAHPNFFSVENNATCRKQAACGPSKSVGRRRKV